MDLGTVKKNIKNGVYKTVEEVIMDLQLIWDNCKTYNAEGSVLYFYPKNKHNYSEYISQHNQQKRK